MKQKTFALVGGIIFLAVSLLHLSRVIWGWPAVFGDWTAPMWISWFGFAVAGYLAYQGLRLSRKS